MIKFRRYVLTCLAFAGLGLIFSLPLNAQTSDSPEVARDISALLQTENLNIDGVEILTQAIMREVYSDRGYKAFWTSPDRVSELLALIENAQDHGLNPEDYNVALLHRLITQLARSANAELIAEEDILLTESLLRYGYHRRYGKVKASSLDPDINFRRETFRGQAPAKTIEEVMSSSSLAEFIDLAAPSGPVYRNLQRIHNEYLDLAENGGWSAIADGPTLRSGDTDLRVAAIRQRLMVTGALNGGVAGDATEFDATLKEAVKTFQAAHALDDDGIVGKQTLSAMNTPIDRRLDQLKISLERLRWVNQEAADTLVAVNIAGFRAFFYRGGNLEWATRAMVGKHYRKTPVFRGDIAYLEFNPTWTIPPGILRNDTLPAIKKNPNYLASKNIQVIARDGTIVDPSTVDWNQYTRGVPYTLRQEPGPINALGTVKFIFPNEHFVFLHDTPHRELFSHAERAFSSGCIRIEHPLTLAELILNDPEKYPQSKLEDIIDSRKTVRINPEHKIPVVITYLTASVGDDGKARFYRDIYNRDQKVLDALNGPVVIDPPSD